MTAAHAPRLVIANRGEIARRILRAARDRGFATAVVSTKDDADAPVRREADAVLEVSSFLSVADVVSAAKRFGATLLHPGYGFLSENADFAAAVEGAGITFVGPTPENMRALGGKESAKAFARALGVPTLNALLSHELSDLEPSAWKPLLAQRGIVPPYLVKASGGGGGKGMRVVEEFDDLAPAIHRASQEALAGFGDATVFVERYLAGPRHIEIQVFGDGQGGGVFLGERECSLQRRHQKVIEEAPSSVVGPELRERMGKAALALVRETRYRGAGTVEFLLDGAGDFFFLEMNTRLQVEHPVTEIVYGVDLVQAQFTLALGKWPSELGSPTEFHVPVPRGVALEARILAEDPRSDFLPTPGSLHCYVEPTGPGVRVDSGVVEGGRVNASFDSMISKLIVTGNTRQEAVFRLREALMSYAILGCTTNIPFLFAIASHPDFLAGLESTAWIAQNLSSLNAVHIPVRLVETFESRPFRESLALALGAGARFLYEGKREEENCGLLSAGVLFTRASAGAGGHPGGMLAVGSALECGAIRIEKRNGPHAFRVSGSGVENSLGTTARAGLDIFAVRLPHGKIALAYAGDVLVLTDPGWEGFEASGGGAQVLELRAPMAGKVLEVRVGAGQTLAQGEVAFVVESMKMQLEVRAAAACQVREVLVKSGDVLSGPDVLAVLARESGT